MPLRPALLALSILFGFAGRSAPLRLDEEGLYRRGFTRELDRNEAMPLALYISVFILLASTTIDNVRETEQRIERAERQARVDLDIPAGDYNFDGNVEVSDRALGRQMKGTKAHGWLSWITGKGKYQEQPARHHLFSKVDQRELFNQDGNGPALLHRTTADSAFSASIVPDSRNGYARCGCAGLVSFTG